MNLYNLSGIGLPGNLGYAMVLLFLLCGVRSTVKGQDPKLLENFEGYVELESGYDLHWSVQDDENITFAVRVKTTGWIGFGLSMNGNFFGSDVIMGWIDDNGELPSKV